MLTLRRAQATDAAAMLALQQRAFAEEARRCGTRDIPPLMEQVGAISAHIAHEIALVAALDGLLVGCVRGIVDGRVCTVRGLVVEPAHHGAGIGSRLLKALEAELRGVERIDLTTNTAMPGNVPFYERHGYRVTEHTRPMPGIVLAQMSKRFTEAG